MEQPLPPDVHRLLEQLKSRDPIERIRSVQGLAKLDCHDESVHLALEKAAWSDPEVDVRSEARYTLGKLGFPVRAPAGWVPAELAGTILPEAGAQDTDTDENVRPAWTGTDVEKLNLRQQFLALRNGMSPKTVAHVLKGSNLICLIILLLIIMIAKTGKYEGDVINWYFVGLVKFFIFTFLFDAVFVFVAPVRCDHEGCRERMHRAWIDADGFRLTYQCDRCGYTYDTGFSFGGDTYN
jgi:hypothetical protein